MQSYLLLPAKKGVQNRRFWQSLAANGRRVAEYHLRRDSWTLPQRAKYNAPCTMVQVSRRSSGAGICRVRPCVGYGRCLFDSRPRAIRRNDVSPWGRQNIIHFWGMRERGLLPPRVYSPLSHKVITIWLESNPSEGLIILLPSLI